MKDNINYNFKNVSGLVKLGLTTEAVRVSFIFRFLTISAKFTSNTKFLKNFTINLQSFKPFKNVFATHSLRNIALTEHTGAYLNDLNVR